MTAKQIAGYLKAKKDAALSMSGGVSFNDAYNKATYGITMDEYRAIDRAMHDAYGLFPKRTPAGVREAIRLHGPSASRHHATKKSPAQLQREIDEALAAKTRGPAKGFETEAEIVARTNGWTVAYAAGWLDGQTQAKHGQRRDPSLQTATDDYARGYSLGYGSTGSSHSTISARRSHSTMQRHFPYRVGKDQRLPSELRGKAVVYLGNKELPAGGGTMARVALLRSDGSTGEEYLVREHHLLALK